MRTEQEMMSLILDTAKGDDRIRAVIMNGSRANPNAPKDIFQDYDIVYIVEKIESFTCNHRWIDVFGKRIILQMPETMRRPMGDGRFNYLMLFEDKNRIDLTLLPIEKFKALLDDDSESILLLDKDGIIPPFPPASDRDYFIKAPSKHEFESCCNNFLWCTQNVAKGLWRDELPYAMAMLSDEVKAELDYMVKWFIGVSRGFNLSAGKFGKYYKRFLDPKRYAMYEKVYADSDDSHVWDALFCACALFKELGLAVSKHFRFNYPINDDEKMIAYLKEVRELPRQ